MAEGERFEVIDARIGIDQIQLDVRHRIAPHLPGARPPSE
jgi:hypothetical protein